MPVLKQMQARPLIRDAVVLDLGDLAAQGRRVIEAARERAEEILAEARREAQALNDAGAEAGRAAGHAEGLEQGLEQGRAAGHAEAVAETQAAAQPLIAAFSAAVNEWDEKREAFENAAHTDVLRLAVSLGRKVAHRHVHTDPRVVADQVAAALRQVLTPTDLRLRVHPDDRPVLAEVLPDLLAGLGHLKHVDLDDDPGVGRGGCAVDLPDGAGIDASMNVQLERIAELLLPGESEVPQETPVAEAVPEAVPAADSPAAASGVEEVPPAEDERDPPAGPGPEVSPED